MTLFADSRQVSPLDSAALAKTTSTIGVAVNLQTTHYTRYSLRR